MYVYLLSMYYHVIYCLIRILTSYYIFQKYGFYFQYLAKRVFQLMNGTDPFISMLEVTNITIPLRFRRCGHIRCILSKPDLKIWE